MGTYKLRIKIGAHEFEAEGPEEIVREQFEQFKSLIKEAPLAAKGAAPARETIPQADAGSGANFNGGNGYTQEQLSRLYHHDEKHKLITLSVLPTGDSRDANSVLLILLGYKLLRGEDVVPVSRLMSALKKSGCNVDRLDRAAYRYIPNFIMKAGRAKGGKYQLTNPGTAEAKRVMDSLLEQIG